MPGNPPKRRSFLLTVEPVNFSLTDGTNIPPPPPSPPPIISRNLKIAPPTTINAAARRNPPPPTADAATHAMPGAFPADDPAATSGARKNSVSTVGTNADPPATAPGPTPARPHGGVPRRMFSLSSLRQSFSSSRTSLALPRSSQDPHSGRPKSPSVASTMASIHDGAGAGAKRPRRGSGWFGRRRSSFWGGTDSMLDVVSEDPRESKRLKEKSVPLLPDVGTLRGGRLNGGELGWDEGMFRKEK